jgi:hypothetical protein
MLAIKVDNGSGSVMSHSRSHSGRVRSLSASAAKRAKRRNSVASKVAPFRTPGDNTLPGAGGARRSEGCECCRSDEFALVSAPGTVPSAG